MADKVIRIETEYPISISTERPVSITSEGGTTTLRIEGVQAEEPPRSAGLASVRPKATPLEPPSPAAPEGERCNVLMPRTGKLCARRPGHNGNHMPAEAIARKQAYNKKRARERYQSDPDYAEKVRAQSRASHKRTRGDSPATE